MVSVSGVVFPPRRSSFDRLAIEGLPLFERAVLALRRSGIERLVVAPGRADGRALVERLDAKGVAVTIAPPHRAVSDQGSATVLVSADVVFDTEAIAALIREGERTTTTAVLAKDALGGLLAYLQPGMADEIGEPSTITRALWRLYDAGRLTLVDLGAGFCQPIPPDGRLWELETDDIRSRTPSGGIFTRMLRRFSVPTTVALLRLGIHRDFVVGVTLALAMASALAFAQSGYWMAVAGALLFGASAVLRFSQREMLAATCPGPSADAVHRPMVAGWPELAMFMGLVSGDLRTHGPVPLGLVVAAIVIAGVAVAALVARLGRGSAPAPGARIVGAPTVDGGPCPRPPTAEGALRWLPGTPVLATLVLAYAVPGRPLPLLYAVVAAVGLAFGRARIELARPIAS